MAKGLKSCPSCRALIDSTDKVCPYCGDDLKVRVKEVHLGASSSPGIVTGYIIGICILFFVFELIATVGTVGGQGIAQAIIGFVPGEVLVQMGARYAPLIETGEWWRLIVPIFLHGNLLHLLFNVMALVQVGPLAENAYGRSRFIIIFFVAGVAGSILGLYLLGGGVGVGASGALFGLIGAAGVYGHRRGDSYLRRVMVQWGLYALVFGFLVHADNAAHIGGLVSGIILSFVVGDASRSNRDSERVYAALAGLVTLVTVAAFAFAVYGYTVFGRRG